MGNSSDKKITGLKEAANLLQELGICKAFREGNKINSPNCYRFGQQDPSTHRWSWSLAGLLEIARNRRSVSTSLINEVAERYGNRQTPWPFETSPEEARTPAPSRQTRAASRAELEKSFRDYVRTLEAVMKQMKLLRRGREDRRTLGKLIFDYEQCALLGKLEASEEKLVNNIRNGLNHPSAGDVSGDLLQRGLEFTPAPEFTRDTLEKRSELLFAIKRKIWQV